MRILVIQLARLGDILQTLPTIAGLKKRYQGCEIDIVVRETFAEATLLSPHVDRIIAMPTRAIFEPIIEDMANASNDKKAISLAHIITWIADQFLEKTHKSGPYDLTLNFTFSESSSYLAQIIPSKEIRGLKRAKDGAYAVTDPWGTYIYSQVLRKNLNMLHLNDLFARMANVVAAPVDPEPKGFDSSYDLGKNAIGLQIGASQSNKTLNVKTWGAIAKSILENKPDAHLVIFGGRSDKEQCSQLLAQLPEALQERCTSLVGRLKYHHNVAWVKRCHYMITPDTAMVHLAPMCGVKTINISVGDVNPMETGPYGDGHWVLRPTDGEYADIIDKLVAAVLGIINTENPGSDIPAFRTKLVTCSDGTKRSQLDAVNFALNEINELMRVSYYLLAEFRNSGRLEDLPVPSIGTSDQPRALEDLKITIQALDTIRKLAEFGQTFCLRILQNPKDNQLLKELGAKITEIEGLYRDMHAAVPYVRSLLDLWEVSKENVIGDTIEDLASLTEGTFRELIQNIDMIHQLIQLALDNAENRLSTELPETVADSEQPIKERENEDHLY
jgi:ADP-heptose:LPS heptosyltransferase